MSRRIALVVGVGNYIYYPPLKCCPPSAEDIFEVLVSPDLGRCDPDHSVLITAGEDETLTASEFDDVVKQVVETLETGDQFLFYFCGHGRVLYDDFFLLLTDSPKVGRFRLRSYDFASLARALKYGEVGKAILIVDTCHSAAMIKSMKDYMDGADWSPHDLPPGIAYMAATGEVYSARQEPRFERTLFSYYFCSGVRNWNKPDSPYITPSELRRHINEQLEKNYPEDKQRAHAWIGEGESDIWISLNPAYERLASERTLATTMPAFDMYDSTVNYHLRIYREGTRYTAEILVAGQIYKVPIQISLQDLVALNRLLQDGLNDLTRRYIRGKDGLTLSEEESYKGLRLLAELGHYAFKRVFGHHTAQEAIQELFALGREAFTEIVSEDFFLPWDLLYPVGLDKPLSYEHFWGMNHIISRVIVQASPPKAPSSHAIEVVSQPRVALVTSDKLPGVEKALLFFWNLADEGQIELFELRHLDYSTPSEDLKAFKDFLGNAFDLVHLACHAQYSEDSPSSSSMIFSDSFRITLMDMEVYDIFMNGHPLVILNAARTAIVNPMYHTNFPATFLRHGARGVVATEANLPDEFAIAFTEQFYRHFLAGKPVGKSLLAVRRYFLETFTNPLGLLYSLYGAPSTRLVRPMVSDYVTT